METTIGICFYCKHVINGDKQVCKHCGRQTRVIKVRVNKTLVSPRWKFWNKKYHYEVLDSKWKYLEVRINEGSTNA